MIERCVNHGTGCSLVRLQDVDHVYLTALPQAGTSLAEQLGDALAQARDVMLQPGTGATIVAQTVFAADVAQLGACRRVVAEFYGNDMPATTYVPQPPCEDRLVAVEAFGIAGAGAAVDIQRPSPRVVTVRHDGVTWCHCGDVVADNLNGALYARTRRAFGQMASLLEEAGFDFSQVVRTWLYLGDIVGPEAAGQRYQELNRARADFFANVPFGNHRPHTSAAPGVFYPASTGIGAQGDGVAMSCLALRTQRDDLAVVPLENPCQTSAYSYQTSHSPRRPRFSRAVAVAAGDAATLFVSGTASITESESRHVGDVRRQTHQTLDNIAALVSAENCVRYGLAGAGATLHDLAHLRVYLKRPADYAAVRQICCERVGPLPTIYAVADVCRPELLVEIEGVAFSTRQ